ncbi:glycosyltransferase family 4 protein [Alteraurantiacibacter aquimixticola]|uniref:Glycosyltransferase family 1 protein n=1 Tax=Alteraurantiacibacter aquimixticola TaxID=2489173 RepID=A0A4T3EX55_9SPHN|nr:glycosyltransferase family 1 protein [Alteraurantiacibacter aquimixticola]TIX49175.1 glycosyltransferase family 1 protein [Alteraurantiacibacter aquimixticola]
MRIALVTDAWEPQVNGVVRTLGSVTAQLRGEGHQVELIAPDQFRSIPCPTYPEIRLALAGPRSVGKRIARFSPDAIHIATEGPLGWAARRWCLRRKLPFTTAYHTQFPQYVARRTGLPVEWIWPIIRHFHRPSAAIMVATDTIARELEEQGLTHLRHWSRGVDIATFQPDLPPPDLYFALERPIQLYVGRVAVEKNIEAFLASRHPGSKVVVGDGPALESLKARFPDAHFLGRRSGEALAACYAGADVFVFPSRTDTFGLVMIEALACGTPVAAYPVAGPLDVLSAESGAMDEDLDAAIAAALTRERADCLRHGRSFSWEASARQFREALCPAPPEAARRALEPLTA